MQAPDQPHVRAFDGCMYVERVPSMWVQVCDAELWTYLLPHERIYMLDKAVKHGLEKELPREVSRQ